ncbi:interferon-related developmental regulator (IFRD) domain-containing protein [Ditylenchus destructor]|nr:interferon-related developmental regulator (IFRD) domain-containing protein [Ditylenchus destructor]
MGKKRNNNKNSDGLAIPSKGGGANYTKDSDVSDLESIAYSSVAGDIDQRSNVDDEDSADGILVDSFGEQIENAQDKRVAIRNKAIVNLNTLLKRCSIYETVEKWKQTLCDIIEKGLKRTPEEAVQVCPLAALLCLHLGVEVEEAIADSLSIMRTVIADASAPEHLRSVCAQTIGLCVYLSCEQFDVRYDTLQTLKEVWSTMKMTTAPSSLFAATIASWVLLLERCDTGLVSSIIDELQPKICKYLESPSVDVRISAAEALAVLHEVAVHDLDENYRFANHNHLEQILGDLAVDSSKFHAKRDKKAQKFTLRQINDAIFNDRLPQSQVKFNKREVLQIEGCHTKLLYDSLCVLLKSDMNKHLSTNEVLRELFDLGPLVEDNEPLKSKDEKTERMNYLGAVSKARNIRRAKQRDRKAV